MTSSLSLLSKPNIPVYLLSSISPTPPPPPPSPCLLVLSTNLLHLPAVLALLPGQRLVEIKYLTNSWLTAKA